MLAAVASPASRSPASIGGEHPLSFVLERSDNAPLDLSTGRDFVAANFATPAGAKSALPSRTRLGNGAGRLAPLASLIFVELIRPGCGPPS